MFGKVLVILLVLVLAVLLVSCGSDEPCLVQAVDYFYEVDHIVNDLFNATESPFDDFAVVEAAEKALEEVKELKPPACAKEMHRYLIESLEIGSAALKADAIGSDETVDQLFDEWDKTNEGYLEERRKIEHGEE